MQNDKPVTTYKPKECPSCKKFKCGCVTMTEKHETTNDWAVKWLEELSSWFSRRAGASFEDMEIQSYTKNAENSLRIADILRGNHDN